jgi:cytosolic 5'-nucleotidase 3
MTVIISNPDLLEKKLAHMTAGGAGMLHIVADFDATLTPYSLNGIRVTPTWEVFELTEEYRRERAKQVVTYHPIELDHSLPPEVIKAKMAEWVEAHLQSLIRAGLTKDLIEEAVATAYTAPRPGLEQLCTVASYKKIPFLIFSAGLGDVITEFFRSRNLLSDNMHIIANFFKFDDTGKALGFEGEVITPQNKSESRVRGSPYAAEVKVRKNVILLGDSVGDIDMARGFEHDEIIKIGFLNNKTGFSELFSSLYDAVIVEDGGMEYVVELLARLTKV